MLNSAFCSSSTGFLSGAELSNGPAGLSSIALLLQAPCPVPFRRAELHLQAVKPSCLLQFDLQALMAWHSLLISSLNYSQPNNTQLFSQFLHLSTFYLFCLIETIIILSPLSLHFAKQKQLFQSAQSTLCTLEGWTLPEPLKISEFYPVLSTYRWNRKTTAVWFILQGGGRKRKLKIKPEHRQGKLSMRPLESKFAVIRLCIEVFTPLPQSCKWF